VVLTEALTIALCPQDRVNAAVFAGLFVAAQHIVAMELRRCVRANATAEELLSRLEDYVHTVFAILRNGMGDLAAKQAHHGSGSR
jgi:hypothetical protein